MNISQLILSCAALASATITTSAQSILTAESVTLDDLSAFETPGRNWTLASDIAGDPRNEKVISAVPGTGIIVNTSPKNNDTNLFTSWEHGDIEVDLEFLMSKGSNSGVYLQSRYEVQLFDSWGVVEPKPSDCGGIYQRWNKDKKKRYEGTAPLANASRAPGLWQKLHIVFQAPRFNKAGKKIENARFLEVRLNGYLIHENVEVTGPTRAAAHSDETSLAPLMIQGDHGPVAIRNISAKKFTSKTVTLSELAYDLHIGKNLKINSYDSETPSESHNVSEISLSKIDLDRNFAVTHTGYLNAPTAGLYAFHVQAQGSIQLIVDGKTAILPLSVGGRSQPIQLESGSHPFRLDYVHGRRAPELNLAVEGPGIRTHSLTPKKNASAKSQPTKELVIEPTANRVRVQRGFIPHDPKKRLYAIAVGSSTGIHYAYDFDTASLLHLWNGRFLDTFEMWIGRGNNQLAKPAGPTLTLPAKPTVAILESTSHDWPDIPDDLWESTGYSLDPNGQPEFHAKLAQLNITDRIEATTTKRGLKRSISIEGNHTSWVTGVLLAEASSITPQENGSYIIGEREYYIDVSADNKTTPFVRRINDHDQLIVWVPKAKTETTINYSIAW